VHRLPPPPQGRPSARPGQTGEAVPPDLTGQALVVPVVHLLQTPPVLTRLVDAGQRGPKGLYEHVGAGLDVVHQPHVRGRRREQVRDAGQLVCEDVAEPALLLSVTASGWQAASSTITMPRSRSTARPEQV